MKGAANIAGRALDLLFPPKCIFCGKLLEPREEYFCHDCGGKLPMAEGEALCRRGEHFDRCAAPLYYRGLVRRAFLQYKFHGQMWHAHTYAAFLEPYVRQEFPQLDAVTWSPISRRRARERGYDQAELIAKYLARRLGLPCRATLQKAKENGRQSRLLHPEERRANVQGVYQIKSGAEVAGKTLLLVDDVITTGSTLEECARILLQAGASSVHCAALAQADGHSADDVDDEDETI